MAVIMLIEDNAQISRLVNKLLSRADHKVIIAETGEDGLTHALEDNPDLLLIDLGLPDIDGQTVIAMLRQQPALQQVPFIAFTAWPESTAHNMAKVYGCDGVIIKPMDTRTFVGQIEDFLKKPHQG